RLPDDRDHRYVVEFGVIQTIEQMHRAWPGCGGTDADTAAELRVAGRLESGHFFVPGLDELRIVFGASPGGQKPVDTVAGITKDAIYVPFAQSLQDIIGYFHRRSFHVSRAI